MLKKIKQTILHPFKTCGVFSAVGNSEWRRQKLLILGYHGIALDDEHRWNPAGFMHQDCLRARLELIKKLGYTVLRLDEALRHLYEGDLPKRSLALTFDDGTYDFYEKAYPVLKEFNFPVTLYLTTFYSHYNRPVFGVMSSYLLWRGQRATLNLKALTGRDATLNLASAEARIRARKELDEFAVHNKLSAEEKDDLNGRLAKQLDVDYDQLLRKRILHIMMPEEVRRLASDGVDIQLHTHRHRVPLDRQLFMREIEDNRKSIQAMTGSFPTHFCYPSGIYDNSFIPWLMEMGIESATTCDADIATRNCQPLLLPRLIDTSNLAPVEFQGWLVGLSAMLPHRKA